MLLLYYFRRDSTHFLLAHSEQPPSDSSSINSFFLISSRSLDCRASFKVASLRFTSENGAKGQGSRSPSAFTWIKPLPAERHPPNRSSSAGNPAKSAENLFL